MNVRLIIADDHPVVLRGITDLLGRVPDFEVLQTCDSGSCALGAVREHKPDVLVADHSMPDMTGIEVSRQLRAAGLDTHVLLLAAQLSHAEVRTAVKAGIRVLVLKETAPDRLVEAVRKASAGQHWVDDSLLGAALDAAEDRERPADQLTPREREVLEAVMRGLSNRRIARRLKISESTVKVHLHNIYQKLDVRNRVQLVLYAHSAGINPDSD